MPSKRLKLELLSKPALEQIEATAYRLLHEVGVSLQHETAVEMLQGHGCRIQNGRVLIPRDTVQWALDNVTPHQEYFNVDGSPAFRLGDDQIRFHNGGGPPFIYDLETGKRRLATLQDVADMTRVLDALPNVDEITPLFGPQDVPPELLAVAATDAMLRNTRKPVGSAAIDKPAHVPYVVAMAAACCGGMEAFREHPSMSISVSPVSPLTFTADVTGAIMAVAGSGAPFHALPAPSLGATAPITLAGALAQQHAEVLTSFVIVAATRPGAPVVYCSRINPVDLRTAISSWGGPEVGMAGAGATQLAHRLGFPCDTYGLSTSSSELDSQFAYERLANTFVPALAGADMMSGVGATDSGLAGGLQIAVIDDEIIGLIKHIADGCPVNEETLAFDAMKKAILRDGVFLGERHTVQHMRQNALWTPAVSNREKDGDNVLHNARNRARQILQTHKVEPLPESVQQELDEILARARRELVED